MVNQPPSFLQLSNVLTTVLCFQSLPHFFIFRILQLLYFPARRGGPLLRRLPGRYQLFPFWFTPSPEGNSTPSPFRHPAPLLASPLSIPDALRPRKTPPAAGSYTGKPTSFRRFRRGRNATSFQFAAAPWWPHRSSWQFVLAAPLELFLHLMHRMRPPHQCAHRYLVQLFFGFKLARLGEHKGRMR